MKKALSLLRSGFEGIIDAIVPPKERTRRTQRLELEQVPLLPSSHELLGSVVVTLMDYRAQKAQDLIQSLKYDGNARAAKLCASVLAEYLAETLSDERLFSRTRVLLVPVPLHLSRRRERGFNQIEVVLRALPPEFRDGSRSLLAPDVLLRSRATQPQTRLPRSARLSNVAGAFSVRDGSDLSATLVYVIDDVATTGATLLNAGNALRRAGASVTLLALARA